MVAVLHTFVNILHYREPSFIVQIIHYIDGGDGVSVAIDDSLGIGNGSIPQRECHLYIVDALFCLLYHKFNIGIFHLVGIVGILQLVIGGLCIPLLAVE